MSTFIFTLIVKNCDIHSVAQMEQLIWERGDIYASETDGEVALTIASIESVESRIDFVHEAISFLNRLTPAIEVLFIDPDLVGISDIASRAGCSREAVRLWANSTRGRGNFPTPIGRVEGGRKIWDWPSVNEWLNANARTESNETGLTRDEFAAVNGLIRNKTEKYFLAASNL